MANRLKKLVSNPRRALDVATVPGMELDLPRDQDGSHPITSLHCSKHKSSQCSTNSNHRNQFTQGSRGTQEELSNSTWKAM